MTHSPTPWKYKPEESGSGYGKRDITGMDWEKSQGDQSLVDANGEWIVSACSCCDAVNAKPVDMKRIELCVNYCEGLTNEELEKGR